jgi:Predicted transcriptional regulators
LNMEKEKCEFTKRMEEHGCNSVLQVIDDTFYAIGGKWKVQIIIALFKQSWRFNELQRTLGKISARVLSNELKNLELNGFINRNVDASTTPVMVKYELTNYSEALSPLLIEMLNWGLMHRDKIKGK